LELAEFITISVVKPLSTSGLSILAIGGVLAAVGVFTRNLPGFYLILFAAIGFHLISLGFQIALLVDVSKETLGIQNEVDNLTYLAFGVNASSVPDGAQSQSAGQVHAAFGFGSSSFLLLSGTNQVIHFFAWRLFNRLLPHLGFPSQSLGCCVRSPCLKKTRKKVEKGITRIRAVTSMEAQPWEVEGAGFMENKNKNKKKTLKVG
jgi:hypothetical protein